MYATAVILWRTAPTLVLAFAVQIAAAAFFVADAFAELFGSRNFSLGVADAPIAFALCIGIFFVARDLRDAARRSHAQKSALDIASGQLALVIDRHFDAWHLTPSERHVAKLSLAGFEVGEIASMRNAASGTVRAQLTRIYAKSGVGNQAQLASVFVQKLLSLGA